MAGSGCSGPSSSYTSFRDAEGLGDDTKSYTSFRDLGGNASSSAAAGPGRSGRSSWGAWGGGLRTTADEAKCPSPPRAAAAAAPAAPMPPMPPMPWEEEVRAAPEKKKEEVTFSIFSAAAAAAGGEARRSRSPEPTLAERFMEWRARRFPSAGDEAPWSPRGTRADAGPRCPRQEPSLSQRFDAWSARQGFAGGRSASVPPPPPAPRRTWTSGPTHYSVLGVSRDATDAEIKAAFRRLALENHPDRRPGDGARGGGASMARINEAWSVLSDPAKRGLYDVELRVGAVRT